MSQPTLADFTVGAGALTSPLWFQALANAEPYIRAGMLVGGVALLLGRLVLLGIEAWRKWRSWRKRA